MIAPHWGQMSVSETMAPHSIQDCENGSVIIVVIHGNARAIKLGQGFIDWRSNEIYSLEPCSGFDLLFPSGLSRTHPFNPMMAPIRRAPRIASINHPIWI